MPLENEFGCTSNTYVTLHAYDPTSYIYDMTLTLKAPITKTRLPLSSAEMFTSLFCTRDLGPHCCPNTYISQLMLAKVYSRLT